MLVLVLVVVVVVVVEVLGLLVGRVKGTLGEVYTYPVVGL